MTTDDVERHPCPRCRVEPGSPCRSRSGAVAGTYHTGRFTKVAPARQAAAGAHPGRPRPGPAVAARHTAARRRSPPDTPSADIRIGYARCSHLTQELQSQLDALAAHGIPRDKIFSEKISTRVRVRPQFEAALRAGPRDQGPRPALPGHLHRVRDEAPRPRRRRAHRARRPPHRPRPGPGDARRAAARHLRPQRPRPHAVRVLRRDGRDRTREHPRSHPRRTRRRRPQGQARRPAAGHHRRHAAHRAAPPRRTASRSRRSSPT